MSSSIPAPNATRWILLTTILASSMAFIDGSALRVALPRLQADLQVTGAELIWVENAYMLMLSALILLGGSLGDQYGRKRVFGVGIGLFTIASVLCGLAPSVQVLIPARALQGMGGALMVPGSLALISALIPAERRGQAIGTWSTFSTLTTLLGPALGGVLAQAGLWRLVFFINVPLAAIALWALLTRVPENRSQSAVRQLDYPGALLVTLGLAGLTFGLTEAPARGLTDPLTLLLLIGGTLALLAFVLVEARSSHPMMPLRLFRSRTFAGTNALTLCLYAALSALPFFLILNLQQVQQYDEAFAGLTMLPIGILLTAMSRWAGGLVDRVGARLPLTIGPLIAGVGFALFALPGLTAGQSAYWTTYFPPTVVLGIGLGITVAPLTTAVMGAAPADSAGTASGINNAIARTAGVLAIASLGALALVVFAQALDGYSSALPLDAAARAALSSEAAKLAGAQPPAGLTPDLSAAVTQAIRLAFVDTFRLIALIAAGLAWLSAALAALLVRDQRADSPVRP